MVTSNPAQTAGLQPHLSGGLFRTVNDAAKGAEYFVACAGGTIPEAPLRALAERATEAERPSFPGAPAVDIYTSDGALSGKFVNTLIAPDLCHQQGPPIHSLRFSRRCTGAGGA